MLIAGIDEAGRGPVIGPMVICGIISEEKKEKKFREIGVNDSKLLSINRREELFPKIIALAKDYQAIIISPAEIDEILNSKHSNLNWLEAAKSAEIINYLKPDKAYLDCPSTNTFAYKTYLMNLVLDKKIEMIAEHKADSTYPVVMAASIIAKVIRDREIEKIKKEIGINFGSGYPSDPQTRLFLEKYWNRSEFFSYFRKTWKPYKDMQNIIKQKNLFDY